MSGGHGAACQETGLLAGHFPSGGETAMEPSVSDRDLPALPSGGHRVPATQGVASLSFCKSARERGFLTPHTSSGPFAEAPAGSGVGRGGEPLEGGLAGRARPSTHLFCPNRGGGSGGCRLPCSPASRVWETQRDGAWRGRCDRGGQPLAQSVRLVARGARPVTRELGGGVSRWPGASRGGTGRRGRGQGPTARGGGGDA